MSSFTYKPIGEYDRCNYIEITSQLKPKKVILQLIMAELGSYLILVVVGCCLHWEFPILWQFYSLLLQHAAIPG